MSVFMYHLFSFYLKQQTEIFCWLVHFLNVCKNVMVQAEARNPELNSGFPQWRQRPKYLGLMSCCPPGCTLAGSCNLKQRQDTNLDTLTWDVGILSSILIAVPKCPPSYYGNLNIYIVKQQNELICTCHPDSVGVNPWPILIALYPYPL